MKSYALNWKITKVQTMVVSKRKKDSKEVVPTTPELKR